MSMMMKQGYLLSQNIPSVSLTFIKLHLYDYLEKVKKNNRERLTKRMVFLLMQTIDKKLIFWSHAFIGKCAISCSLLHRNLSHFFSTNGQKA